MAEDSELSQGHSIEDQLTVSCSVKPSPIVTEGEIVTLRAEPSDSHVTYEWRVSAGKLDNAYARQVHWDTGGLSEGNYTATVTAHDNREQTASADTFIMLRPRSYVRGDTIPVALNGTSGPVPVTLQRSVVAETVDLPLWVVIRNATESLSFTNYSRFMDMLFCGTDDPTLRTRSQALFDELKHLGRRRALPFNDTDAYRVLKIATEAFLIINCGVTLRTFPFSDADLADLRRRTAISLDSPQINQLWTSYLQAVNGGPDTTLPYLAIVQRKLRDVGIRRPLFADGNPDLPEDCFGIFSEKLTNPCLLELIWSYWHEEGMLVQTTNVISRRFQNIRSPNNRDPLAMFETDPLRPLNNLLWGYIQDEQHRLSVVRRAYEYDHHYGLGLVGKAIPNLRPADSRSKFLEAFHNLLSLSAIFFEHDDHTTVIADGFPVLNALKDVHLLLSQGAHNQFGDLPSTARQEMLIQQWVLSRPEFREFLPTRIMVAYPESWMDRVDAMKTLQGWTDIPVLHFRNLAIFGEQILLSVRFGAWLDVNDPAQAANWARFWRAAIQNYVHAYRAVTGVDLTADVTDSQQAGERYLQPAVHLRRRLEMQQKGLSMTQQARLTANGRNAGQEPTRGAMSGREIPLIGQEQRR